MNYYATGLEKLRTKDYVEALKYFGLYLQNNPHDLYTVFNLILVNIRLGDFKSARKIYTDNYDLIKNAKRKTSNNHIILESSESNYLAALKLEYEVIEHDKSIFTLKELANINMNLGNFGVARKIYETMLLSKNERIKVQSLIYLVNFYIQIGDYEKATYYCSLVDLDIYTKYHPIGYFFSTKDALDAYLGVGKSNSYVTKVIKTHDEDLLINHIKEHFNLSDRYTNGCFMEDIDIPTLLKEVRELLPTINGSYNGHSLTYRYRLDKPIGYWKDELTNDLCIIKSSNDQIISMYPCHLSSDFDKEGWLTSEKLRLKRERGIKNEK